MRNIHFEEASFVPQCTDPNLLAWKAIRFGAKWNNYAGTQSYVKIPLKKKKDQCGEHSKHRREGYEGVGIIGHILLESLALSSV